MQKLCELFMIQNGILLRQPPEVDDGEHVETETCYQTDDKLECVGLLYDIADLCSITSQIQIKKARKVKP